MKGGQQAFILNINVLPSILTLLSIHNPILRLLSSKKTNNQCSEPYFVNSACDLLIRSILTCRFAGDIATYFLQRCCIDLFINFSCQDIQQSNMFTFSTLINRDIFSELFDYLVDHPQVTHTVKQLSEMFVIDESLLRFGFRKYFSIPVEAFMKMNKMILIFNLIAHPEAKLSMISSITGFNSVAEMRQTFYEYYGLDIPVLRKSI
jgi:AraC-like DNA-binding protein